MKKTLPSILVAAGVLLVSPAQAQVNIYCSGAASVKDVINNVIFDFYGPNLASRNVDNVARPENANRLTLTGQMTDLFGNQTVTVSLNYSGSGAAVQSLTQNSAVAFFSTATPGNTNLIQVPIDVGFSIAYQRDYPYPTPILNDTIYGVTPTIFVKSISAPATLTNLTSQHLRLLAANGSVPQSILTGRTNDTNIVYWITRDISAAHRILSAKEAGFSGSVLAYAYDPGTSAWNLDTVGRTTWPAILNMLTNHFGPCITFLTPPDAPNLPPENILSFNGVHPVTGAFSRVTNDFTPVITGQYTTWGYEHIFTKPNSSPNVTTFVNALKVAVQEAIQTSPYSIPLDRMQVSRSATGGVVSPQ